MPAFVAVQLVGGVVALGLIAVLYPELSSAETAEIVMPQETA